jgi:hypothetical protein
MPVLMLRSVSLMPLAFAMLPTLGAASIGKFAGK